MVYALFLGRLVLIASLSYGSEINYWEVLPGQRLMFYSSTTLRSLGGSRNVIVHWLSSLWDSFKKLTPYVLVELATKKCFLNKRLKFYSFIPQHRSALHNLPIGSIYVTTLSKTNQSDVTELVMLSDSFLFRTTPWVKQRRTELTTGDWRLNQPRQLTFREDHQTLSLTI